MGLKILIVDDSLTIRLTLRRILGLLDSSVEVSEAEDGEAGLERMRASRPDLVLADLNMDRMTGLEMIDRMKLEPGLAPIPVVVISSEGDPELLQTLRLAGVRETIRKPFDLSNISAVLEREISRGQALSA